MIRAATHRLAVGLMAVVLVVASCGGSDEASSPGPDASATDRADSGSGKAPSSPETTTTSGGSAGCDAAPPEPDETTMTVTSGGEERSYLRYIPKSGASREGAGDPAPLVLDFPAYPPAEMEAAFSGLTKPDADGSVLADEVGAVVITPEPINGAGALLTWNYVVTDGWTDDIQFVVDLLDEVEATVCIDADRVLATGFAVGGVFASIVTCELPERIAVLATVSGLYDPEGCAGDAAKPVVSFHGTGDRFIPFDGSIGSGPANLGLSAETTAGLAFMFDRPGAIDSSNSWAERGGCATEPVEEAADPDAGPGVTRMVWPGCDDGADVELYVIDGGEHAWPGSIGMAASEGLLGPVSDEIDATEVIWAFFEAHA